MKFISKIAIVTSVFLIISVIYSVIFNVSLYTLTIVGYRYIIFVSVMSIFFHFIAMFEDKDSKIVVFLSSAVPIAVLSYYVIGLIGWYYRGI